MDRFRGFERNLEFHFSELLEYPYAKPYWIYISLSHRCTYNCKMCGVVKILKGYELAKEVAIKALDEIHRWQRDCVLVFTGGEPFLRKDIFDIFAHAIKKGLKVEAVSNGALIDEKLASRIVACGLQNIAISLDGAKEATHDSIREKGSYSKALAAIKNLVSAKKRLKDGPQISVWTTIMKENINELSEIIPLVSGLGVECLVYHPVIVAQDDMQNTSANAPFWIRGENLQILRQQIEMIIDYRDKNGLIAFLHDPYLWLRYFEGGLDKSEWKCNPFVFINIGPDGEMRSCGSAFGNIKESSLEECLSTEHAARARKLMKECKKPCLQTCWARPESDSLKTIVESFISDIARDGEAKEAKRKMIERALDMLSDYEKKLVEKNA